MSDDETLKYVQDAFNFLSKKHTLVTEMGAPVERPALVELVSVSWAFERVRQDLTPAQEKTFNESNKGAAAVKQILDWVVTMRSRLEGGHLPGPSYTWARARKELLRILSLENASPKKMQQQSVPGPGEKRIHIDGTIGPHEHVQVERALQDALEYFETQRNPKGKHDVGLGILKDVRETFDKDTSPVLISEIAGLPSNHDGENTWARGTGEGKEKLGRFKKLGVVGLNERLLVTDTARYPRLCSAVQNELFELAWRIGRGKDVYSHMDFQVVSKAVSDGLAAWVQAGKKGSPRSKRAFLKSCQGIVEEYRKLKSGKSKTDRLKPSGKGKELLNELVQFGSGGELRSFEECRNALK